MPDLEKLMRNGPKFKLFRNRNPIELSPSFMCYNIQALHAGTYY